MADPLIELMGRILTHIPEDTDVSLAILKGHLIIEEELNNAINEKVKDTSAIESARKIGSGLASKHFVMS